MAVGTHRGYVQIWDAATGKKICVWKGHRNRVGMSVCFTSQCQKRKRNTGLFCLRLSTGVLAWNSDQLSSGSCDCTILQRDTRTNPLQSVRRLKAHKREVCGLKWNSDRKLLASGDNDNKVEFCSLIFSWLFIVLSCSLVTISTSSCWYGTRTLRCHCRRSRNTRGQ